MTLALLLSSPDDLRFGEDGEVTGSGHRLYQYDSGSVMLEEQFVDGTLRTSRWFRPDGSVIAETEWRDGGGVGYFLRQDGTIRSKMTYRGGLADGPATYYKDDGVTVDRTAEFSAGVKVSESKVDGSA